MAKEMTFKEFSDKKKKNVSPQIETTLSKTISLCCEKVRSDIQDSMAHTARDTTRSYYTNNRTTAHHPTLPGNPPAPDTGNLRNSIRYEMHDEGKEIYGIVGTTQKDPNYGEYLEYGTTKIAPRPWLRPAMLKNESWIRSSIAKAVADGMKGAKI